MKNASQITLDECVQDLIDSELGILLLKADGPSMFDVLSKKTTHKDRQGMFGADKAITYHLYSVLYSQQTNDMINDVVRNVVDSRSNIINNIFTRWDAAGHNTRHAKNPYSCKAFMKYIDDMMLTKADYVLLLAD